MQELSERGFVVLPGMVSQPDDMARAYDAAVTSAADVDVRIGSASTRVTDFVNRGVQFDDVYILPPLLAACRLIIGERFKLSSFHARTLRTGAAAEELHTDVRRDSADWPLVSFILMIDAFRPDNGATRFVPGSHLRPEPPGREEADHDAQELACGPAGSLLIFHGSAWHGHSANTSTRPRRSLQGAFVPHGGKAATDFAARMLPETRARLGPDACVVLGLCR